MVEKVEEHNRIEKAIIQSLKDADNCKYLGAPTR